MTGAEEEEEDAFLRLKMCPMCEAAFNQDIGQEAFEAHTIKHFNYKESETLRDFDILHDAAQF